MRVTRRHLPAVVLAGMLQAGTAAAVRAQTPPAQSRPLVARVQVEELRTQVPMDPERARQLYVSTDPAHHSLGRNFQRDVDAKASDDRRYPDLCKGIIDFAKVSYRSSVGDMDIPAYVFQPLQKRGARKHAAMVWVHGGVHGNWGTGMWPFVREAVERGYVIICPDYRGSTGYGKEHHNAIDYGGYEVDATS